MFIHAEWLYAVRASSPNWWGELFYKGLSVYPIPSYPALLHKDTTSWNNDDQDYIQAHSLSMHPGVPRETKIT